ncbi:hypothetical protein J2Y03_002674 [Neobacillus niacini]|uniref:hypothetical protein n=1 Tax=Neobacillus niacini TaxID=86668 RepID=UPI001051C62F|nr:hypothetical protein [Neobacillus niacini]MDR7077650.1 hypothetical protein [Neobacillus niacini]
MSVFVYQTFVIKQDKFKEAIDNLREIKKFRNENYNHHVEILTPISGEDHTYALLSTYDGLGEMELENKRLFDDEEYIELIGPFFLENISEASMYTQIYRGLSDKKKDKKDDNKKKDK